MNILVLCSALNNSYFGFEYEGKIFCEIIKSDINYHSLYLISKIKELSKKNNIDLNNLDFIAVNCGQGSFTGIRVALTIAKVIAGELNLPVVPLYTTEILLEEFNCDCLIMDARRDMYFVGTKEKTELILKDKIDKANLKGKILTDKRTSEYFKNSICYEDIERNLNHTMLKLAKEKFINSKNPKDEFNYIKLSANYIQTPPIF